MNIFLSILKALFGSKELKRLAKVKDDDYYVETDSGSNSYEKENRSNGSHPNVISKTTI